MTYRIKNFEKFQHFKDRSPPWIKLYRDILDDPDWHELDPESAKVLVMLWLIASEDETKQGNLPEMKKLAFRLRIEQKRLEKLCIKLSHWLEQTDIELISSGYQTDAPERAGEEERREETEGETETDQCAASQRVHASDLFEAFYSLYPKKRNRGDAEKVWKRIKPDADLTDRIVTAVKSACSCHDWQKDGGKFIPYPASWLSAKGWEDEISAICVTKEQRQVDAAFAVAGTRNFV